ncbi:sphingosine-1-phosphate transporter SPNS2 isoform X2 [Myotis daubentonii]|uniref:sphingosine-1-phosphate transporter SPNS2 isoform X2 n=1 Tax=Myotis daubentonii TaxID=98922 RepID=UPI0028739626|nr:sphingosine-1-phosphate transporter SPNS2 isoform X2 [Myotis daubentonii]
MMCLECASAAAGGAEEEEADAERRRRRRGAQLGASGGGCCGARAAGAAGVAAADDEVQTLSGSVRRAPSGPPSSPSTPSCAAAAKGPGAQQPKPASLGRRRGAAAAILSLGNVLNYLDRRPAGHPAALRGQGPRSRVAAVSVHLQLHGGGAHLRLPGRPLQPEGDPQLRHFLLVGSHVLQLLHLPAALLAAGGVPGAGGHRGGQLLHHRAHHHRRPLHQEHAHAHAVRLLLRHPAGQRPGLHHWLQREAGSRRLALGFAGVPYRGHDHRNAHPRPGPSHEERPCRPARGAAQGPDLVAPRHEGPDPQGPWACGSRCTCTAPKSCRRRQRRAAARPVGPRTASSSGPSPALRAFWVWSRGQEPLAGAACGPSEPTRWCVLWACWALPSSSASSSWPPRAASWGPISASLLGRRCCFLTGPSPQTSSCTWSSPPDGPPPWPCRASPLTCWGTLAAPTSSALSPT